MLRYLFLLLPFFSNAQSLQLAPPRLLVSESFFQEKAIVQLEFDFPGAEIFYQIDAGAPRPYKKPVVIRKTCVFSAFCTHPDFTKSVSVTQALIRVKQRPSVIRLATMPHQSYPGSGANGLIDFKQGSNDLHDGQWMGFAGDTVVLEVQFSNKTKIREVVVSALNNPGAWVFPMRKIEVFKANADGLWQLASMWETDSPEGQDQRPASVFRKSTPIQATVDKLKIVIYPFGALPDWHPGKGSPAWLFLDELLFQ